MLWLTCLLYRRVALRTTQQLHQQSDTRCGTAKSSRPLQWKHRGQVVSYEGSIHLSTEAGNVLRTLYAFVVDSGMLSIVQSGPLAADPLHFPTPTSSYPLGQ